MPIPKCLYSSVSWFSNAFIIVMQDCHPARVLSNIDEAKRAFGSGEPFDTSLTSPIEHVELACDEVTKMHAKYLNDRSLTSKHWIIGAETRATGGRVADEYGVTFLFVTKAWAKTRAMVTTKTWPSTPWPDRFVGYMDELAEYVQSRKHEIGQVAASDLWPFTLVHGDFHGHNILIKDDGPRPDTVILDFQILQLADPVADLGKLLLFALSPEVRRANEERLVRKSYDAMLEAGLDGETYPFSLYFDRYKFEGAVAVMMVVSLLDTLMADGKDDEHIVPMIFARLDAWFDDHGNPFEINERTTALREKLLEGAR